ncbi:hypothetical protein GCK72_024681 [Caenorhabditis remanei]|uniref:Uncharacterized protein n=1 Tax=Caenorhabditis remanei TaxID=31234 RepID=A0A6A5G0P4_CAERE|nr:hypothetical protein GCK72_024681 [Caenorhabditis remanei]KAF1748214.1 hypothetical protein GCK72_024681 [Caenorhabditis remanei]
MAFRKVINPFLILFLFVNSSIAVIEVDVSKISINFGSQINTFISNCFGVDMDFYLLISTSNFSQENPYYMRQQDASQYSVDLPGTSSFLIQSTTDFISLTGVLSMRCSNGGNVSDSFLISSQSSKQNDKNNQDVNIQVTSNSYHWTLTATINRKCNGANQYGFNCNEQCTNTNNDDNYYCYTCGANGQKTCCPSADVNPDDCSYYNHPVSSTWSPNTSCSASAENTYFWLMISFAIIIAILAILLLLVLLELCCGLFMGGRAAKGSEDGDWIVPKEPKANRELYDADINRHHQYRRRQEETRESSEPDERDRRSPYIVSRQGMDNQSYDDEVLRNEWQEPQPRRIARV